MKAAWILTVALSLAALCAWPRAARAMIWNAGLDLEANELPDGNPTELSNPNPKNGGVWSYGYRSAVASTLLTLFSGAGSHTDAFVANSKVEGWRINNSFSVPAAVVNASGATIPLLSYGAGPLQKDEMLVHPGDLTQTPGFGPFLVVRWTAPAAAVYGLLVHWQAIHAGPGSDGEDVHVVLNGVSMFDSATVNGGPAVSTYFQWTLPSGSTVDFVTGPKANFGSDSTDFNAIVTDAVPEPATLSLLALGGFLGFLRRRRNT